MLSSDRIPDEWKRSRRIEVQQPTVLPGSRRQSERPGRRHVHSNLPVERGHAVLPLLVLALASDLVSGERTTGTIKMPLTRPVRRWKILFSKLVALSLYVSLTVVVSAVLCYLISGTVFGYKGGECLYLQVL